MRSSIILGAMIISYSINPDLTMPSFMGKFIGTFLIVAIAFDVIDFLTSSGNKS